MGMSPRLVGGTRHFYINWVHFLPSLWVSSKLVENVNQDETANTAARSHSNQQIHSLGGVHGLGEYRFLLAKLPTGVSQQKMDNCRKAALMTVARKRNCESAIDDIVFLLFKEGTDLTVNVGLDYQDWRSLSFDGGSQQLEQLRKVVSYGFAFRSV